MIDRPHHPAADIQQMLGMTQLELVDYLTARGVKTSLGAVRSWSRGFYTPPEAVYEELWSLWIAVEENNRLPPETPESVRERQRSIEGMRIWYAARHPELDEIPDDAGEEI
ncbi:hypothetical protein [Aureimonas glaciei]|uniref:Uncharacterized protein n=1 Tax=Aureimonas glaciei TaxID=1776957 RepID=A0A916Y358_9HYPH|nr:hypothetical protein [Aureimonas glaciei]GGD28849.1 hypothetical protein GCM10011335_35000 [Aureimonas glaciei]